MILKTDIKRSYDDPSPMVLIFGPGIVRYLEPRDVVSDTGKQAIEEIDSYGSPPVIRHPSGRFRPEYFGHSSINPYWNMDLEFNHFPSLFGDRSYADIITEMALISKSYSDDPFPSDAYWLFSQYTDSSRLVINEFVESWVREPFNNDDLTHSYSDSDLHVLVSNGHRAAYVFRKTPFLIQQRSIIEAAETEILEAAQQRQHEEAAFAFDEAIRKSAFDVFTYLMEDTRNGLMKIGKSRNPVVREKTLQSEASSVILRIAVPADNEFESELHSQFHHKRRRGEWFDLDALDIKFVVERLLTHGDAERTITSPEWIGNIFLSAFSGNGANEPK